MSKRTLTRSEKYGIAVYYACGAPIKYISEHFNLHRATIRTVLVEQGIEMDRGKRSAKAEQ